LEGVLARCLGGVVGCAVAARGSGADASEPSQN